MGPKDETSAKGAGIREGLIESLGFEPADGKKFGRSAVAEVSDQISEAGFAVPELLDSSNGEDDAQMDVANGAPSNSMDKASGSDADKMSVGSDRSRSSSKSSPADTTVAANLDDLIEDASVDNLDDLLDDVAPRVDPEDGLAATDSSGPKVDGGNGSGVPEVVAFNPGALVPTMPPVADTPPGGPAAPAMPAVTGEHVRVNVPPAEEIVFAHPIVDDHRVVDSRSIIDKPRSVSDLFSGGITGRRRLQARKVRRVIRHVDPWSVLTFSVLFHLCLFAALLLASVLVWNVADEAGTIENMESFIRELGDYETFEIDGEAIFRAAVAIAGIMTLASSVLVVLLTVMFNLLSDLLGGVRVTVIEEETLRVKPGKDEE